MKSINRIKLIVCSILFITGMISIQGCSVYSTTPKNPLAVSDIVRMSKEKVPSKDIIRDIRKSHTVYDLNASQFAKLQADGVSDSVVNYMQKTQLDEARYEGQRQYSDYFWPGYYPYWYGGFGWPYYGYWGGPTVILNYRGGEHHGGRR